MAGRSKPALKTTLTECRDEDMNSVARLLHLAFAGPQDQCEVWVRKAGIQNLRVLRREGSTGDVGACLLRVPMGQYFGGRSVPMIGIAGVAVGPESRGQGLARSMMEAAIREMDEDRGPEGLAPISVLYASTQALYRQVGYEQAGHWCIYRLPIHRIDIRERAGELVPLGDDDMPAVRACYSTFAGAADGPLDRGEYIWKRIRSNRETVYTGFGVPAAGGGGGKALEGYLFVNQTRKPETGRQDLAISDLAFNTPRAARRLLGFLADFATMGDEAVFHGGPMHPLLMLMGQQHFSVARKEYWMLRVVRVKGALEARGYAAGLSTGFTLRVSDEAVPRNAGPWRVQIEGGRASVTEGTGPGGELRTDIRTLGAMYTGFLSPRHAAMLGLLEGDDSAIAAAAAAFAPTGGGPWMTDMF